MASPQDFFHHSGDIEIDVPNGWMKIPNTPGVAFCQRLPTQMDNSLPPMFNYSQKTPTTTLEDFTNQLVQELRQEGNAKAKVDDRDLMGKPGKRATVKDLQQGLIVYQAFTVIRGTAHILTYMCSLDEHTKAFKDMIDYCFDSAKASTEVKQMSYISWSSNQHRIHFFVPDSFEPTETSEKIIACFEHKQMDSDESIGFKVGKTPVPNEYTLTDYNRVFRTQLRQVVPEANKQLSFHQTTLGDCAAWEVKYKSSALLPKAAYYQVWTLHEGYVYHLTFYDSTKDEHIHKLFERVVASFKFEGEPESKNNLLENYVANVSLEFPLDFYVSSNFDSTTTILPRGSTEAEQPPMGYSIQIFQKFDNVHDLKSFFLEQASSMVGITPQERSLQLDGRDAFSLMFPAHDGVREMQVLLHNNTYSILLGFFAKSDLFDSEVVKANIFLKTLRFF